MSKNGVENFGECSEITGFLRLLAESLEKGHEEIPQYHTPLLGFEKMKISIKRKGAEYKLKMKLSFPGEEEEEDKGESYKTLKKRMKIYFKEIKKSLDRRILPSSEIINIFLEDSRKMVQYTGTDMGEELYPQYLEVCSDLEKAYREKDIQKLYAAYTELERQKRVCHEKYK
ncbi:MAG: GAK system XXXCH domain-containing protein [Desulfonatronovibrionaceae bacterium]